MPVKNNVNKLRSECDNTAGRTDKPTEAKLCCRVSQLCNIRDSSTGITLFSERFSY